MSGPVLAAGTSIDVEVRADPGSCAGTAAQLAALAGACAAAGAQLTRHASIGEDVLGGLSGIVYRQSSTLLAQACERTARRSRRLAEGLQACADGMGEVRRLMDQAVAVAAPHLEVLGSRIWSPARPPGPDDPVTGRAWGAWHDAVGYWRQARAHERQVGEAWLRVMDRGVVIDDGEPPPDLPGLLDAGAP